MVTPTSAAAGRRALALAGLPCAEPAFAHAFAAPYVLPVPFWMYAYGASTALVVSFLIAACFVGKPAAGRRESARLPRVSAAWPLSRGIWIALRALSLALLCACIATGLLGTSNPILNISMTVFWILFLLGLTYLTAIVGDVYAWASPIRVLCDMLQQCGIRLDGRRVCPRWLSYWPAALLYVGLIWIELFGHLSPRSLALVLLVYVAFTIAGAWMFGARHWLERGECFAVHFRLVGLMAPVEYLAASRAGPPSLRWRVPLSGLLSAPRPDTSLQFFILFMLAATAYDGAHETQPWARLFWGGIYPLMEEYVDTLSAQPSVMAAVIYRGWQWTMLAVAPIAYLLLVAGCAWASRRLTNGVASARTLRARFAMSLIPIAFVYHVAHYYTVLLAQGSQLPLLLSDPFGFGWNRRDTAADATAPLLVNADVVWHSQVALILAGHIASVFVAHLEAQRTFASPTRAVVSQLPMLLLMVGFTAFGLWILSLPLAG